MKVQAATLKRQAGALTHGGHTIDRPAGRDAPWIDYRASVARADHRCDPPTCEGCGCELDVHPVPHSPRCPEVM